MYLQAYSSFPYFNPLRWVRKREKINPKVGMRLSKSEEGSLKTAFIPSSGSWVTPVHIPEYPLMIFKILCFWTSQIKKKKSSNYFNLETDFYIKEMFQILGNFQMSKMHIFLLYFSWKKNDKRDF